MLTRELAITHFDWHRGCAVPDRLTRRTHAHYLPLAQTMLQIYARGMGSTRQELHRAIHRLLGDVADCPLKRADAFCKLLDERAEYDTARARKAPALRRKLFQAAAAYHPLVEFPDQLFNTSAAEARQAIAAQLGVDWESIERDLFADVIEFHRLKQFAGYDSPQSLLSRYNIAQCQVILYDAVEMVLDVEQDLKPIIQAIKLARLMHRIEKTSRGYRIVLDGPASILRETHRYGAHFARLLPSLISHRGWRTQARLKVARSQRPFFFHLSHRDGYTGDGEAVEPYDSSIEQAFADKWGTERRDGWSLQREDCILTQGQKVFLPDFSAHHADGRRVLIEVVGFWTPEYLTAKAETLQCFAETPVLLIVANAAHEALPPHWQWPIVTYKSAIKISDVLAALPAA